MLRKSSGPLLRIEKLVLMYLTKLEGNPFPEISPIQVHLVSQLLHNLKPHKAAGPDNFPSYFLKEVANEIAPALTTIVIDCEQ